jgi:hypothetical protein
MKHAHHYAVAMEAVHSAAQQLVPYQPLNIVGKFGTRGSDAQPLPQAGMPLSLFPLQSKVFHCKAIKECVPLPLLHA